VRYISRRDWQGERRDDPSLSEVLYVLRERRLLVAGVVLVLVCAVVLFGLSEEPVYTAEATVSVSPQERLSSDEQREAFLAEVRGVVATEEFLREVMRRADWRAGSEQFTERLDPQPLVTEGGESMLRVRFSGSGPEQAAHAANAYAELFVERVEQLNDERLAGGTLAADASLERRAAPPERSSPRVLLYAAVATGAGMLLGAAGALLLEGRAHGWRDVRDAELTLRAPVLGAIPDYSSIEKEA
jgi:capsular polysaccharide biosynthesis protein